MILPKVINIAVVKAEGLNLSVTETGEAKVSDYEGRFLNAVVEALNVTAKFLTPSDHEWGRLKEDGNWTGMVGMVHRGETDLAMTLISPSTERMPYVDFSTPYAITETTFAIKKPGFLKKTYVYIHPFALDTWLACAIAAIVFPLMLYLFVFKKNSFLFCLIQVFGNILRQPFRSPSKRWKDRIFVLSWWFFAFIISSSYCAVLLSYLTLPLTDVAVDTLEKLSKEVTQNKLKCYFRKGTLYEKIMCNAKEEYLRKLGEAVVRNKWYTPPRPSLQHSYADYVQNERAVLMTRHNLEKNFALKQNILISKDYLIVSSLVIVVNKKFCCLKKLNSVIFKLVEAGIYSKIFKEECLKAFLHSKKEERTEEANRPLRFEDLFGAFLLLACGLGISSFVFILEVLNEKFKRIDE